MDPRTHRDIMQVVLCLVMLVTVGCAEQRSDVERNLVNEVKKGPGTVVNMAAVATFEWDYLYVFLPYTQPQEVRRTLGFWWAHPIVYQLDESDGFTLLVFVRGRQVAGYVLFPANIGWFDPPAKIGKDLREGYRRENAAFRVAEMKDSAGNRWGYLLKVIRK